MTEVLFYHLTDYTLERALPGLLERCLERKWNVVIQTGSPKQIEALDEHLWSYRDDSFLPHASKNESEDEDNSEAAIQPIWITDTTENPNSAKVRFVVHDAVPAGTETYKRLIYMFDGRDEDAVASARERWKIEKSAGHDLTYWQQDEEGRWSKKA